MGLPELDLYIPGESSPTPHGPTKECAMGAFELCQLEDGAVQLVLQCSYNPWTCYPTASLAFPIYEDRPS